MSKFNSYKVVGERNTGTNFLQQFLASFLPLKPVVQVGRNNMQAEIFCKSHGIKKGLARHIVNQRVIDKNIDYNKCFMWKHAAASLDFLSENEGFEKTLFICLIRNPYRFLLSLYKKPYNLIPNPGEMTFSEFIRAPILLNERDLIDGGILRSPLELWNIKVSSYFDLLERTSFENVEIVFYEDLVQDPFLFALNMAERYSLNVREEDVVVPGRSTKYDDRTFEGFKKEVKKFSPYDHMSASDVEYIKINLNKDILVNCPASYVVD